MENTDNAVLVEKLGTYWFVGEIQREELTSIHDDLIKGKPYNSYGRAIEAAFRLDTYLGKTRWGVIELRDPPKDVTFKCPACNNKPMRGLYFLKEK